MPGVNQHHPTRGPMIHEPATETPVVGTFDLCVIGGGCTGVFAAVQAARMGASVALIERGGFFGGVATAGLVNIWHSLLDTAGSRRIIAGLTDEVLRRLLRREAAVIEEANASVYARLNSAELICELDALVCEHRSIRPFLHARFVKPIRDGGRIVAAIIEDKTGRRAVRAARFIDATGDGDLIERAGLPTTRRDDLQPPTVCAILAGLDDVEAADERFGLDVAACNPDYPNALKPGFVWHSRIPGLRGLRMVTPTSSPPRRWKADARRGPSATSSMTIAQAESTSTWCNWLLTSASARRGTPNACTV